MEQNKEWYPGMDMGFEVGDTAYFGGLEGKIVEVNEHGKFPIEWKAGEQRWNFKKDGRLHESHTAPSLFFKPQHYDISRPAWEPKPGEWCFFWDERFNQSAIIAQFKQKSPTGFITEGHGHFIKCAPFKGELPEHLKEK